MGWGLWEGAGSGKSGGGAGGAVFGERMRAGAVLVGAGEVWRDVEDRLFIEEAAGCCWTVGGLVAE